MIPLVDLAAQHAAVKDEVAEGWQDVLARTAFVGGPNVAEFENAFAQYTGAAHCVGVGNGTDAIEIALRALGVSPGDECILPANTFVATAEAVRRAGATPVLVDCADDDTYLIDQDAAVAAMTPRTRAIIPVHLYGQVAPLEAIIPSARRAGAWIVEDAAQAQGARRNGAGAGAIGDAAATSFYPGKNLGAYGDAGAALTNSADVAARMRSIRDHGAERKYEHDIFGFNSRMDALQAVVLSAKLRRLENWNSARREAAARYTQMLEGYDEIILPHQLDGNKHVWHLYVVRVPDRDRVIKELNAAGIGAGVHYPIPVHLSGAFSDLGYKRGEFPVTERAAGELLSLPLFAEITEDQQKQVVTALVSALRLSEPDQVMPRWARGNRMDNDIDCGIVIVTYNSAQHVQRLLDSLPEATRGLRTRCVVVDNNSADETLSIVSLRPDVSAVDAGGNLGYAGAINVGRGILGPCKSLLILNADLVLDADAVTHMYRTLQEAGVGVAVPMLLNSNGALYLSTRREPSLGGALGETLFGDHWKRRPGWLSETIREASSYDLARDVDWAGGAALLISADCDAAVGAWDEERFFLYSEETDFAARARRAGFRIRYVPAAKVRHEDGGSGRSSALLALMAVNRIRYYEKYHRGLAPFAFRAIVILHYLLRATNAESRFVLKILLGRSRWNSLPGGNVPSRGGQETLAKQTVLSGAAKEGSCPPRQPSDR